MLAPEAAAELAPTAVPPSRPAPAPAAAPNAGLPAAAPSAAPAAAPTTVPTAALPTMLWFAASARDPPPIWTEAYCRHDASSCWKASNGLSLPGSAIALGPVGGATVQAPRVRAPSSAIEGILRIFNDPRSGGAAPVAPYIRSRGRKTYLGAVARNSAAPVRWIRPHTAAGGSLNPHSPPPLA